MSLTSTPVPPRSAAEVVRADLDDVLDAAGGELAQIAGKRLLVTGGAGFLGYYLVQVALAWNESADPGRRIARSRCSTASPVGCRSG